LVVILAVVTFNAAIAIALGATFLSVEARVAIERVPGGVAAIVWTGKTTKPDLIITGLSRQSYPIDERVLQPMLRRHGSEKLSRLIVLSADYNALKDVLRLSERLSVDTVYAERDLAASIRDMRSRMGDSTLQTPVIFFTGQSTPTYQNGYFLSRDRITWRQGETRLDIVDQVKLESLTSSAARPTGTLVICRHWYPTAEDWIHLRQAGYERIVCAKIEQPREAAWPDAELGLDALPDYLHDLSRSGSVTFHLGR